MRTSRSRRSGANNSSLLLAGWILAASAQPAAAQALSQRGFVDARGAWFPQQAPNDPTRGVADLVAREEVFARPSGWLRLAAGIELRVNSHDQVEDEWRLDVDDRGRRRPRLALRRLSATFTHRGVSLDVGKQFIRWGKTDIVAPTDRFAPRDFLNVLDNDFLAVTGARGVVAVGGETLEAVWVPRFTPSRVPLLDQRWGAASPGPTLLAVVDGGAELPSGPQTGIRWSHVGRVDTSLSFYDGFNHLPNIAARAIVTPPQVQIVRVYPSLRSYGADAAVPTRWVTIKGEAAYFTTSSPDTDEYVLYVVQLERQTGEWVIVGGYAGEIVTARRAPQIFAPDRGVARSFVGRASYTIDPNRSIAFETAVRQTLDGAYAKGEFSQGRGQHWRATVAATFIRGRAGDFLGEYRRNSNLSVGVRYSF